MVNNTYIFYNIYICTQIYIKNSHNRTHKGKQYAKAKACNKYTI